MSTGELACTYASLLLHEGRISITVHSRSLFFHLSPLEIPINMLIGFVWLVCGVVLFWELGLWLVLVGLCGASIAVATPAAEVGSVATAASGPATDEKKEEANEEAEEEDYGFNLFD
ncbi:60S acidic ribosomal protein family [Quillaja saponaria]|uniref:60S acidic ribosomal protein family n=1 Tax=Quillaja saponaria TaxID=32244 RepID=A0AAD7LB03_QUISA|nr:60S acidic ribosomal protein family [Quillaja saponaria]